MMDCLAAGVAGSECMRPTECTVFANCMHVVVFDQYTRNLKPYFVHEDSLFMELQAACSCIACMIVIWYRFDSPLFPVFLCGGGTIRKAKSGLDT